MPENEHQDQVALFFTGGTICMRPRPDDSGIVPSNDMGALLGQLSRHVPDVGIRPVHWGDLPSPHMTPDLMFRLAQDINQVLMEPEVLGAVVTHGTDVLVESAFMADLVVESEKPVVFTGSMRFYSELGYDGIRNLLNAIKACLVPLPPQTGVVLLMTDRLFPASEVAKINSLNIDAFEAQGSGPVAYVAGEKLLLMKEHPIQCRSVKRSVLKIEAIEPNVPLITCYTGMDVNLIRYACEQDIAGLVVEGFGAGNVPPALVALLETLVRGEIPVVLTTRCPEGGVWPIYAYPGGGADLKKRGVIMGGRLSGPKARIKLMVALGLTRNIIQIKDYFEKNILPVRDANRSF